MESSPIRDQVELYEKRLQLDPTDVESISNLASLRKSQGYLQAALAGFQLALSYRPDFAELHYNAGNTYFALDRFDEAIKAYRTAIELKPDLAAVHQNLGDTWLRVNDLNAAIEAYQKCLALKPSQVAVLNNLGVAFQKQFDLANAYACFQQAIAQQPQLPDLWCNLGVTLALAEHDEHAESSFRNALRLDSQHFSTLSNYADLCIRQKRHEESISILRQALKVSPKNPIVLSSLVHQMQTVADWNQLDEFCRSLVASTVEDSRDRKRAAAHSPLTFLGLSVPTTAEQQLRCATDWSQQRTPRDASSGFASEVANIVQPATSDGLKIGFMSADFNDHPVGQICREMFADFNAAGHEVFAYSLCKSKVDAITQQIATGCRVFRNIASLNHREAAKRIFDDQLDVLIDLQGLTSGARPEVLAYRPAPIQVNYLGYPGTTGANHIDYLLADGYVIPQVMEQHYSEKLLTMETCYLPIHPVRYQHLPELTRIDVRLPTSNFVFAAFSMPYKISPMIWGGWMRILKSVPDSILWLRHWNDRSVFNLRAAATQFGIASERLFFAPSCDLPYHLARQKLADLHLDTFPYNQHSTAVDLIATGCPLVTVSGETFASRVAGSALHHFGFDDLIAADLDSYEALAIQLALSPNALDAVRERLREFNRQRADSMSRRFVDEFQRVLTTIVKHRRLGFHPRALQFGTSSSPFAARKSLSKGL